jgi:hypothetical protein
VIILLVCVAQAGAAERIQDGGFEGATCDTVDCSSPIWKETVNSGSGVGLLCASTVKACSDRGAAAIGQKWVLWSTLGGGGQLDASVSQTGIAIPGSPASLTLLEQPRTGGGFTHATFTVQVDGSVVYQESEVLSDFYDRKTVDLGQFAGPGTHTLTFHAALSGFSSVEARWNVDDVSLDAANAPPGPGTPTCLGKPATIVGTDAAELLTGTPAGDVIVAGGGDDVVKAGAGNDRVCGGDGKDELRGQGGSDKLNGEASRDRLTGGGGKGDVCKGGSGRDHAARSCERSKSA